MSPAQPGPAGLLTQRRLICGLLAERWRRVAVGGDRGSGTVELVLVTPLLVLLLLFVVLCGRLVVASLDLEAAASAGARAASLARTVEGARLDASRSARETLAGHPGTCRQAVVEVDVSQLRPGGVARVRVLCRVPLADLVLLSVPGDRVLSASATSPVDQWRGGFS